ncbi:hypothetical protein FRC02_009886 [Tulasnella sp. 418]|nr:hypothetical protein FRC02_009886 [Tulasnella sp. 418]
MSQLSNLPLLRGDALQDAEKWKRDFVAATSNLNDEAAARAFLTKIAPDSPASTYIDTLPNNTKASWLRLERALRTQWTSGHTIDKSNISSCDAFESHVLTMEVAFKSSSVTDDVSSTIDTWADEHLRLGQATGWPDEALIRLTRVLLPAFIQSMMSLNPKPTSFAEMCASIKQLPRGLLELERDRYNEIKRKEERLVSVEDTLREMSDKIDTLLKWDSRLSTIENSIRGSFPSHGASVPLGKGESCPVDSNLPRSDQTAKAPPQTAATSASEDGSLIARTPSGSNSIHYSIPLYWRMPSMDKKNTQLAAAAKRAINKLINYSVDGYTFTGLNSAQNANAWSVVAVAAHCQVEPSAKKQKMNLKQGILLNCRWELLQHQPNIVHLQWALTLSYACMATSDPEFFQRAEEYWKIVAETSLLNCGYIGHQKDDMSYHESDLCGGVSSDPLTVGSFETVIFMTLSSLLAHSMNGDQYKKAAILSANCVRDYMMDSVTSLVKGFAFEIQSGQTLWDDGVSCFLTGILLEGLSALAIVTGEPSWSAWARDVADAVMNLGDWHTTNGILSPLPNNNLQLWDNASSKGILVRGIYRAYVCNTSEPEFQKKARAYINVQFNAIRNLARTSDSYDLAWAGPFRGCNSAAQMAAVDVLVAAVAVNQ